MRVKIKRIDPNVPMPEYKTPGSVAFDLHVREAVTIEPGESKLVKTGYVMTVPEGHALLLFPRSSNAKKQISFGNGVGVIDQDYCGPEDELRLALHNHGSEPYTVEAYERLGQGLFVPISVAEFEEVQEMTGPNRGGFGTTG